MPFVGSSCTKPASKSNWNTQLLAGHKIIKKAQLKHAPGQLTLREQCQVSERPEMLVVVEKFIQAHKLIKPSAFDMQLYGSVLNTSTTK